MREITVEKYLEASVGRIGGLCVKFPPLFYSGFPDRLAFLPGGVLILIETKAPRKTPSLVQKKCHALLRRLGFRVEVLDTKEAVDGFILTL